MGAVTFEARATICDAVFLGWFGEPEVWTVNAVDLLLFWRWVSGRMEPTLICVQQINTAFWGELTPFYQVA